MKRYWRRCSSLIRCRLQGRGGAGDATRIARWEGGVYKHRSVPSFHREHKMFSTAEIYLKLCGVRWVTHWPCFSYSKYLSAFFISIQGTNMCFFGRLFYDVFSVSKWMMMMKNRRGQTSMPLAGFEPTVSASKRSKPRPQTRGHWE
jgi:hypothetical protein